MKSYLTCLLFGLLFASCKQSKDVTLMESPLAIVIKLEAAESCKDYDAARNFIDVEQVYSSVAKQEGRAVEDVWKEFVEFNYSIGNSSNKFTSTFPFHKYKIIETINGDMSEVKLLGTEEGRRIKEITYKLTVQNKSWKVVSINYKK
ncbi:MAG: hypothetical protein Kow0079_16840 [Vicingaceae bacterium]